MQNQSEPAPGSPPADPSDWAAVFFARGWRGRVPWVVLEQVWCSRRRFERQVQKTQGGWALGLVSLRVLSAPLFDRYAPDEITHGIVDAIRAYFPRRAAEFSRLERPSYEAHGYPAALLDQMAPQPNAQLTDRSFRFPVLLMTAAGLGRYALLGAPTSFDMILESLVAHREIKVDQALSLLILLTCHGRPGDVTCETRPDGSPAMLLGYLDSAYTRPFHPKRYHQVQEALRVRCADDVPDARAAALQRLLAQHVPRVIDSLRRRPPRAGHPLLSVARSRLAESVSEELSLSRPRAATPSPWWRQTDQLSEAQRRRFSRSLTRAERAVLGAVQRGQRLPLHPSTARVHLRNAKSKYLKLLDDSRP